MDPKYSGDIFKHLEKQGELLMDVNKSMSDTLHRLQVEEEMLMRKYYEFMVAEGLTGKNKLISNTTDDKENGQEGAIVKVTNREE